MDPRTIIIRVGSHKDGSRVGFRKDVCRVGLRMGRSHEDWQWIPDGPKDPVQDGSSTH